MQRQGFARLLHGQWGSAAVSSNVDGIRDETVNAILRPGPTLMELRLSLTDASLTEVIHITTVIWAQRSVSRFGAGFAIAKRHFGHFEF